jgi:tRNA pseudouridine55 synthase
VSPAGIVLIDKPEGITSFSALHPIKKKLGKKIKVGHTGTLDKFATGLLIVCVGGYTRLAGELTASDKVYEAAILFGRETDTLDPEGSVVAEASPPSLSELESVIPHFKGLISQAPPLFSALHINGERAYKRVLRGELFEMEKREVTIHQLELLSYKDNVATMRIHCSKGTYIRSLARDIARAAASCGSLLALRRTAVGAFHVSDAVLPDDFDPSENLVRGAEIAASLSGDVQTVTVDQPMKRRLRNGILPSEEFLSPFLQKREPTLKTRILLFSEDEGLLASITSKEDTVSFDFVIGS